MQMKLLNIGVTVGGNIVVAHEGWCKDVFVAGGRMEWAKTGTAELSDALFGVSKYH